MPPVENIELAGTEQTTEPTQNQEGTQPESGAGTTEAGEQPGEGTLLGGEENGENTNVAPENYEAFNIPEGMEMDTALVEEISPVLKEVGLSQENAQKLVNVYAPYVQQQIEAQQAAVVSDWNKQVEDWKAETTKELGATFKEDLSIAGKFIDKFGSPELRNVLNKTGLGNHIEIVKAFRNAGKAISEDSFPAPGHAKIEPKEGGRGIQLDYSVITGGQ